MVSLTLLRGYGFRQCPPGHAKGMSRHHQKLKVLRLRTVWIIALLICALNGNITSKILSNLMTIILLMFHDFITISRDKNHEIKCRVYIL